MENNTDKSSSLERRSSVRRMSNFERIRNMFEKAQFEQESSSPSNIVSRFFNWIYSGDPAGSPEIEQSTVNHVSKKFEMEPTSPQSEYFGLPSKVVKSNVEFFESISNKTSQLNSLNLSEQGNEDREQNAGRSAEVILRTKKNMSLSSSSFSSFRSSIQSTISTSTAYSSCSFSASAENLPEKLSIPKPQPIKKVNRDESLYRHFDRVYSQIEESKDSTDRDSLSSEICNSDVTLSLPSNQSIEHICQTHRPIEVSIQINSPKVKTHRIRLGSRRLRSSRNKTSSLVSPKTAFKNASIMVDLKMELLNSHRPISYPSQENSFNDYQLHLFPDQLSGIIELLNRYNQKNQLEKVSNDEQDASKSEGSDECFHRRANSSRILPKRLALVRQNVSVENYIDHNFKSMKQIGSPWKNFVTSTKHSRKVVNLSDKEVKAYESIFEVIYSEYSYLQQLKTIIEFPKKNEAELEYLSDYNRRTLFSNIETIYNLNLKLYENFLTMFKRDIFMGDLFRILSRYFEEGCFDPYIRFIKGQNERNKLIQNFELQSLLIAPIKRIGHYPLLLEAIEKRVRSTIIHSEVAFDNKDEKADGNLIAENLKQIEACFETARRFANKCDEALESQHDLQELIAFKTKLIGNITHLVEANRKIHQSVEVKGKKFTSQLPYDIHLKVRYEMFLLTDMLLIVKHKVKKDKFVLVSNAKLVNIRYQRDVRESNFFDWADELNRQPMNHFSPNTSILTFSDPENVAPPLVKFIVTYHSKNDEDKFLNEFNRLQNKTKRLIGEEKRKSAVSI